MRSGATKGFLLAVANVVVIALGIAMMEGDAEALAVVTMFGMVPGVIAGVVLGVFAARLESAGVGVRIVALTFPTVGVVVVLGTMFTMDALIPVASIPSVVAALVLERWTRKVEPPPVPVAHIRAG